MDVGPGAEEFVQMPVLEENAGPVEAPVPVVRPEDRGTELLSVGNTEDVRFEAELAEFVGAVELKE